jgi:GNAT superfamily N-acetyltransferase
MISEACAVMNKSEMEAEKVIDSHLGRRFELQDGFENISLKKCEAFTALVPRIGHGQAACIHLDRSHGIPDFQKYMDDCSYNGVGATAWISPANTCRETIALLGLSLRQKWNVYSARITEIPEAITLMNVTELVDYEPFLDGELPHPGFHGLAGTGHYEFQVRRSKHLRESDPNHVIDIIGWCRRAPVAAATILLDDEVASIWSVGVMPESRGSGSGRAILISALRFAASKGCKSAVWLAEGQYNHFYQRCGFTPSAEMEFWGE